MDTLGRIILSIIERLSSFRGNNVFIQRCPLFRVSFIRGSTVYTHDLSDTHHITDE